jgi:predicted negative regulator of RcsB-dependent stress response
MEFNQEEENQETDGVKQWFQDNLRIIISILVVVFIAGGIYSYSNRSVEIAKLEESQQTDILESADNMNAVEETTKAEVDQKTVPAQTTDKKQEQVAPAETSQETAQSFIETAAKGDGTTKLARKALANYLEKNPDSSLTKEHKIYIEDYLRKNIPTKSVKIGNSVEFSKSLIQDAISKSKNLNENQLRNLQKYAVRVPSLQ